MAGTQTLTGSHMHQPGEFALWTMFLIQPPVAYVPTAWTVILDQPVPEKELNVELELHGGDSNGAMINQLILQTGQSQASGTINFTIPANTTSVEVMGNYTNLGPSVIQFNYTVEIQYSDLGAPGYCQYGTEPAPTAPLVTLVTEAGVAAVCTLLGAPWLEVLFAPLIGYALDTGVLCGSGPPTMPPISAQSLLDDIQSKLVVFEAALWYSVCQCTPAPSGSPPPTSYPIVVVVQPPGWPPPPNYACDNTNICATLQLILKRLDELSTSQQINVTSTTTVVNSPSVLAYQLGAVHAGLTDSGSIAVSGLVGVRVEVTSGTPGIVLPGNPPYYWDQGWLSVSDGGALLLEHRITHASAEWFPPEARLASVVGYYANPGVELQISELIPV